MARRRSHLFSAVGTVGAFAVALCCCARSTNARRAATRKPAAPRPSRSAPGSRPGPRLRRPGTGLPRPQRLRDAHLRGLPAAADPHGDGQANEAEFIGLVPPGQTIQRPAPKEWAASYFAPEPVEIEFLDSSGQHWTRDEQGFLTCGDNRTPSP